MRRRNGWAVVGRSLGLTTTAAVGVWTVYLLAAGYVPLRPPLHLVAAVVALALFALMLIRIGRSDLRQRDRQDSEIGRSSASN